MNISFIGTHRLLVEVLANSDFSLSSKRMGAQGAFSFFLNSSRFLQQGECHWPQQPPWESRVKGRVMSNYISLPVATSPPLSSVSSAKQTRISTSLYGGLAVGILSPPAKLQKPPFTLHFLFAKKSHMHYFV